ncbi:MAG: hypothetical protein ACOY4W_06040, partial [Thermodesulfobacteriota bacterium]
MEPAKDLHHYLQQIIHPRFGNLGQPRAVNLTGSCGPPLLPAVREKNPAYIHLSVTGRCNARCRGCINSAISNPFSDDRR